MQPDILLNNSQIAVLQAQLGTWDNLNHLIVCKSSKQACIVDPFDGDYWIDVCQNNGWNLSSIWLTHSHWDHTKGVEQIITRNPNIAIHCHELEQQRGYQQTGITWWSHPEKTHVIDSIGELEFEVHCTPGHTPGHITIIGNGLFITGDCLFLGRCGRTDLHGGDQKQQRSSLMYLHGVIAKLPKSWLVLPGHKYEIEENYNPNTLTIDDFMQHNEALKAVFDDQKWNSLEFLSFDDNLSRKARKQTL